MGLNRKVAVAVICARNKRIERNGKESKVKTGGGKWLREKCILLALMCMTYQNMTSGNVYSYRKGQSNKCHR